VIVEQLDSSEISIVAEPSCTFTSLKSQLQDKTGAAILAQRIYFRGKLMSNNSTVGGVATGLAVNVMMVLVDPTREDTVHEEDAFEYMVYEDSLGNKFEESYSDSGFGFRQDSAGNIHRMCPYNRILHSIPNLQVTTKVYFLKSTIN
jgi:hypothetical protein